uniref:Uncharacterized protein n=1 Tax=Strombidium rassoulzadegani TaxID=1082188 RepID=A0A7S3FWK4_9SPIT
MQAINTSKKQIVQVGVRTFSSQNTLLGSINPERNHQLRVMSTPTWPVPYYQRQFKHPVNSGDIYKGNLEHIAEPCTDLNAIVAKENLREQGLGYVVEAVENHADTKTFCTSFADSSMFTSAYTEDLLDCLSVAFEQNRRVMSQFDLADVLKTSH